jgi:hypothetical protein
MKIVGGIKIKRIKIIFMALLMVLSTFAIGIAAEAALLKNEKKDIDNGISQSSLSDAEITFYILTGEGCACDPIIGASIAAFGGEGNDSGVTDEDGMCILTLEILGEYEVIIEAEEYITINFEFNVLDDQTFTFHLLEADDESSTREGSLLNRLLTKIFE